MNKDKDIKNIEPYERKSSIALFFSGLFNFYQFAAFEVKQSFLELIRVYVLQMKKELILSLPGFMLCMLPALEDQNSEILKKVENILSETEKIVGTSEFYGEIWKAMLRTPRARLSAIRYLDKRIPKNLKHAKEYRDKGLIYISDYTIQIINQEVALSKDPQKREQEILMIQKMELHDYFYFYYPNKTKLVINALISGLSIVEPQVYVNRGTLDFLISHMPINSDINSISENTRLVECATLAYTKKDFATLNKIQNWLFEHLDEDEEEINTQDPTIVTIVRSQQNLFIKSMDVSNDFTGKPVRSGIETGQTHLQHVHDKLINNPILILLRIMSDEQNTTVPILKELSIDLIKFIRFHLGNRNDRLAERFQGNLNNLLEQIAPYYKAVLESLAKKLQEEIEVLDYSNPSKDRAQLESIDLISFAIFELQKLYKKLLQSNDAKLYMIEIFSNLLKGMSKISNDSQNFELLLPALEVVDQILNIFEKLDNNRTLNDQKQNPNNQSFRESIESFNELYIKISLKMISGSRNPGLNDGRQHYKQELETFKKYNNIMLKILPLQNLDSQTEQMPEWLDMMIQCSKVSFTKICLVSADVFIKVLSLEDKAHIPGGGSVMHIQRLIADTKGQASKLNVTKSIQQFKQEFLHVLQQADPMSSQKNGNAHCKEIIQNLWSILDQEIDTESIVTHLQRFDQLVPRIFSDVVIEDLQNKKTRLKQERAIKKFTIFWKFTGQYYPAYKPFETEVSGKKYLALHNMINFLEDRDPTLRLSCKSWLSQSKQYNRILDPLFEEFIKNSQFKFNSGDDGVIIDGDFETQYVIQNFGKLRNIILNTQDEIIEYIMRRNCRPQILQMYNNRMDQQQMHLQQPQASRQTGNFDTASIPSTALSQFTSASSAEQKLYLDLLVEITLLFIRAEHPLEGGSSMLTETQISETLTVNASACEFMELILKQVEKNSEFSNKIAHVIIKPLIKTFYHVIIKKNYAMQVNVINLMELILNDCNFQGNRGKEFFEDSRARCAQVLKDPQFIEAIILGLKSYQSFVRQKFIKFVEMLVPYMRKFTKDNDQFKDDFKQFIIRLIDCFCELLQKVDISYFSSSQKVSQPHSIRQENRRSDTNQQFFGGVDLKKQSSNVDNYADFDGDRTVELPETFDNLVINQEADIVLILNGLQRIINTCLDIKDGSKVEEEFDDLNDDEAQMVVRMQKNELKQKQGFLGGIFGGGETSYFAPDIFQDVKRCINEKLPTIFVSCIHCWNNFEFLNINDYHFTRFGMFAYNQEDTRKVQEKLRGRRKGEADAQLPTFEDSLQLKMNMIQKNVIQLLRPVAKKTPDQFIEGAINVWLKKSLLGCLNINRSYEKLIQMLVCVQQATDNSKKHRIDYVLPVDQVINSMIKYIQEAGGKKQKETLVNCQRWTKNNPPLSVTQTASETLLNSFLYAYLLYNPSMFDPLLEKRLDDKSKEYHKVYNVMIKYFNVFKFSRNPFTVCWLLEILNLVSIKFNMPESKLDTRLKKEYHDLFNNMLSNCSSIVSDTFNIEFHEDQKYNLAFPPTVYELLWRYEYIAFKSTVDFEGFNQNSQIPEERKSSMTRLHQNQFEDYDHTRTQAIKGNMVDIVTSKGSLFFDRQSLKEMVDQRFEYIHMKGSGSDESIFKSMEILIKERGVLQQEYIQQSDFMEKIKFAVRGVTSPEDMLMQTKFFTIITLKQILCQLLPNLIGSDIEKTSKSMQTIFYTTIQILQNDNKIQKEKFLARTDQGVMNEFITEFFASIVERSHQIDADLIKPYRREIIDLFNFDNFFQMNMLNLKQWQKIMKYFIDGKPDEIFEEQMQKWNFQGGLFANSNAVIAQKCSAMKRIAFLIFSCDDDDFQGQLDQLMKKMIEVFKSKQKNDIKQRLFLFFLTRVMLIRLNFQTLTEALRKLWPHLLNELISVFESKDVTDKEENTDLTIEAIKLVELLSSLNIEDFQMNQWIFLIDGYGMKLENNSNNGLSSSIGSSSQQTLQARITEQKSRTQKQTQAMKDDNQEVFKTFIVRFIGQQHYSFYNVEKPQDGMDGDGFEQDMVEHESSEIKLPSMNERTMDTNRGIDRLQDHACSLQQSINDSNVIGNEFNRQEAESKIEVDFINNDRFINQNIQRQP